MRTQLIIAAGAAAVSMALGSAVALAHHAFAAEFDANLPVNLRGNVTRVEWINPHAWIHVDHKKDNNKATNLKWVKHEEQIEHAKKDPNVLVRMNPDEGPKLTADKVKKIKLALFKSKKQPTLKALAKLFKVSDMQIHRIKTGENWAHVKV